MNKSDLKKYESLKAWLETKLLTLTRDEDYTVMYDSEDIGAIDLFFDLEDDFWAIGFETSVGHRYCFADLCDCETMTVTDIKEDLKQRIEVHKRIEW